MKTRIVRTHRNRCINLVVDDGAKGKDRKVLASMTLFEGTGAWMLVDVRLHRYSRPSAYSGSLLADDVHAHFKPDNAEQAALVRSLLREYTEDDEGLHWSTYEGLVRGTPRVNCGWQASCNHIGYFTQREGLAYLETAQAWWAAFEGDFGDAKIDNPHRQPSETQIRSELMLRDLGLPGLLAAH